MNTGRWKVKRLRFYGSVINFNSLSVINFNSLSVINLNSLFVINFNSLSVINFNSLSIVAMMNFWSVGNQRNILWCRSRMYLVTAFEKTYSVWNWSTANTFILMIDLYYTNIIATYIPHWWLVWCLLYAISLSSSVAKNSTWMKGRSLTFQV